MYTYVYIYPHTYLYNVYTLGIDLIDFSPPSLRISGNLLAYNHHAIPIPIHSQSPDMNERRKEKPLVKKRKKKTPVIMQVYRDVMPLRESPECTNKKRG